MGQTASFGPIGSSAPQSGQSRLLWSRFSAGTPYGQTRARASTHCSPVARSLGVGTPQRMTGDRLMTDLPPSAYRIRVSIFFA